jgi:hypothetical protein
MTRTSDRADLVHSSGSGGISPPTPWNEWFEIHDGIRQRRAVESLASDLDSGEQKAGAHYGGQWWL